MLTRLALALWDRALGATVCRVRGHEDRCSPSWGYCERCGVQWQYTPYDDPDHLGRYWSLPRIPDGYNHDRSRYNDPLFDAWDWLLEHAVCLRLGHCATNVPSTMFCTRCGARWSATYYPGAGWDAPWVRENEFRDPRPRS